MHPSILASDKSVLYILKNRLSFDPFSFRAEGAAALLWIGMHLTDERPWTAARNPVYLDQDPGLIDQATKKILGKRFQFLAAPIHETLALDPIRMALRRIYETNHNFLSSEIVWPVEKKVPGKLLPRKLTAHATVTTSRLQLSLTSRNFSELSQCLHAELTLLFALGEYFEIEPQTLESFHLHTTLKPCRMCAAFLHTLKPHTRSFRVTYDENDPGPLATNTVLDQYGYQRDI